MTVTEQSPEESVLGLTPWMNLSDNISQPLPFHLPQTPSPQGEKQNSKEMMNKWIETLKN